MTDISWAVVLTADEPASLIQANIAWHLGTGAAEVHLYLDRPDDPVASHLPDDPRLFVTLCDKSHWKGAARRKRRPDDQMRRQSLNANHAAARSSADWMLHLDADEFLWQDRPLAEELDLIRDLDCEIALPVAERCYETPVEATASMFGGRFRLSTRYRKGFDRHIFGDALPFLHRGLLAHSAGKCAAPLRKGYSLGIHWSYRTEDGARVRSPRYQSSFSRVLHFDGLTPLHWQVKLLRYAAHDVDTLRRLLPKHRLAQVRTLLENDGDAAGAKALHDRLRILPANEISRLDGFGLLLSRRYDLVKELRRVWPHPADLSVGSFDAGLARRYPEIVAYLAPGDPLTAD